MFKSKDSTLSNPTSNGKLNQINNENLAKCSGTVSSIQRRWTTAEPSQQVPSSSLPSWQADESDWPPSPPRKTTTSISTTPISKSQQGDAKPLHSYLYNSNKSSSITNNSNKVASKRSSNTSIHKLSSEGTRSSIFGQSHLSNPKMSIAAKVTLSPEQQAVLDHVISGKSVFFTGSAGTGKSVLLRHIISALRRQYDSKTDAVAVTASTGMAACAIGGTTIHCFAGIGLGNESQEKLLSRVRRNRKASGKWMRVKALIIDEG
ncbi:PIF1-like helicase-domain-containing protein [Phakopsora pachyrhizi]|nr:PIF1-like helicase-domain-containing protein [Phakopsora pachyrhizi]